MAVRACVLALCVRVLCFGVGVGGGAAEWLGTWVVCPLEMEGDNNCNFQNSDDMDESIHFLMVYMQISQKKMQYYNLKQARINRRPYNILHHIPNITPFACPKSICLPLTINNSNVT